MRLSLCLWLGLVIAGWPGTLVAAGSSVVGVLPPVPRMTTDAGQQRVLLSLINQSRSREGLPPLAWDDKLAAAASDHAMVMAEHGSLSHQFDGEASLMERLVAHSVRLDRASENVVYDLTVQGAHENFMSSAPHRANLLDPSFDAVGVAVVDFGGVLYVVEDFAHRLADISNQQAAQIIVAGFSEQRREAGSGELPVVANPQLQELVQSMAGRETTDSKPALSLPGARFAASYATKDPSQFPPVVAQLCALHGLTHYSVGVTYARTPKYPGGLYWVTIVLFNAPELLSARVQ